MRIFVKEKLLKKIKNRSGETITETLVSLIIIVLALGMLAGSIISASNLNNKVKNLNTSFTTVKEDGSSNIIESTGTVSIQHGSEASSLKDSVDVNKNTTDDDNAYVYYEK